MFENAKYIVFEELYTGNFCTVDFPMIIFPNSIDHSFMASTFNAVVDSAGFIDVKSGNCYGKSISLNKKSKPDRDNRLFNSQYIKTDLF